MGLSLSNVPSKLIPGYQNSQLFYPLKLSGSELAIWSS